MVVPYLETPRTEVGDMTYATQAGHLDFSIEPSFHSPVKDNNDLLKQMRGARGQSLTTPHARNPLLDRRNPPAKQEFTPLLKSAARNRVKQMNGEVMLNGGLKTPAALKPGFKFDSPALPEASSMLGDPDATSTGDLESTPVPPVASSSIMSTPIVPLPRDREGILEGGNVLTLRDQEAVSCRQ